MPANRAYVCLGSNIQPEVHLPAAVHRMRALGQIVGCSSVWQSAPVGDENQADFCNAAILLETTWTAEALCDANGPLRQIETQLGRRRDPDNKNAARTIDLDLALFNTECRRIGHREIPDPEILTRSFLAVPLAEIDPAYRHPVTGTTLKDVADRFVNVDGLANSPLQRRDDIPLSVGGSGSPGIGDSAARSLG